MKARQLSGFRAIGLVGTILVVGLGCSTAPDKKVENEVLIQRQQAVDFASQGDQNMVNRNFSQAEVFYNQSLDANWATDNLEGVIQAHFSLGFLYLGLGHPDRAMEQYVLAAEAAEMSGNVGLRADCQLNRAKVLLYQDKASAALELIEPAFASIKADKDQIRRATFLYERALALKDLGRLDEAKKDLQEALANVKILSGLIPICAWCKKIRNDEGYWSQIELYLSEHSDAKFSHGICPECRAKFLAEGPALPQLLSSLDAKP